MTAPNDAEVIKHLRTVISNLENALKNAHLALATAGCYDLVTWAGAATYEQRCARCQYWVFTGDQVAAVVTEPGSTVYVHRKCVVRPRDAIDD